MNKLDPRTINIIHGLPPVATKNQLASWDVEMFNMVKEKLHRPHGDFASISVTYDGRDVYMIQDATLVSEFFNRIRNAVWVGHNLAFDIRQMSRFADNVRPTSLKRIWDTFIVEKVRFNGYYDDFALNDLFRRYCGMYLDKTEQKGFGKKKTKKKEVVEEVPTTTRMTTEQVTYAAMDVVATFMVATAQREQIDDDDLRIWQEVERPMVWTLQQIGGVLVDENIWMDIAKQKGDRAAELFDKCMTEYGFSIRSNKKVLEYLHSKKFKIQGVSAPVLTKLAGKDPLIDLVLEYRKPQKGASTYGAEWADKWIEDDGRVYASFQACGPVTGRFSCSSPNLQNIPSRGDEGKVYRTAFIAAPSNKLIIADYSSQEPRITAFLSGDEKLTKIFLEGTDIYCDVGYHVFGEKFGKKDLRRNDMKALFLGMSYGMTAYGLAEKVNCPYDLTGLSEKEARDERIAYAQSLIDKFFAEFPGVKTYIDETIKTANKQGYVQTIMGRKIWISPYAKGIDREAPNAPIQGSAADAMKISMTRVTDWSIQTLGYNIVRMPIHDELVCEVKDEDAKLAAEMVERIMIEVAENIHPGIPSLSETHVGLSWADKK